jgi:hypothetical protein
MNITPRTTGHAAHYAMQARLAVHDTTHEPVTRALRFLRAHGITCHAGTDGSVRVLAVYTQAGRTVVEWADLTPTRAALRAFAGY